MSATELIEQVKALPPHERTRFVQLLLRLEAGGNGEAPKKPFRLPDFEARLKRRFPDGGLPGDPQAFWDELRAERF